MRVADILVTGKRAQPGPSAVGVEFVEGDLADLEFAHRAVAGVDYVLHQAAIPSVPRSVNDPITSNRANIDATLNVLVAARDAGVRRLVYAGSSSAYGNTATLPKHEDMPTSPLSPYALQKLVGEQYLHMFTSLYGLETVTIAYFNVFGPRQDPSSPYSGVISLFIRALLENRAPTIYGDGEQTPRLHLRRQRRRRRAARLRSAGASGRVINVATGTRISLNALFEAMRKLIGVDRASPMYAPPRTGDVRDSHADIRLAKELLGYQPIVSFEEGLQRTVDWYRSMSAKTV